MIDLTFDGIMAALVRARDDHRKEFSDMEWADEQPEGAPNYKVGDTVEFHVGGFGEIKEISEPQGGWPSSYSTRDIYGMPGHKRGKCAWHYESDFKGLVKLKVVME